MQNGAMTERVIPIVDQRLAPLVLPEPAAAATGRPTDRLGRPLRDLRISVTDRCNFRCTYCMPKAVFDRDHAFLPQSALLRFEEITRLARLFIDLGVRKLRLTGGEPLLRRNIEALVAQLAQLRLPDGSAPELTLTTNAALLARKARSLREAGLQRVTVSLDALDDAVFRRMNDVDFPVAEVLRGIEAAQAAGLAPIKVNMVVQRSVNDDQIVPMARHFRGSGIVLRFIEFMDVGTTNGWRMDHVLPSREVLQRLAGHWPLHPLEPAAPGETAERWAYGDGAGEIGLISSVTRPFCRGCNRARLSTEGRLYTCLFADNGHDLRGPLRAGMGDDELRARLSALWTERSDRYSELRGQAQPGVRRKVEMSYIGG